VIAQQYRFGRARVCVCVCRRQKTLKTSGASATNGVAAAGVTSIRFLLEHTNKTKRKDLLKKINH